MARILHVADLHQGLLTHSWSDPSTGMPSRVLDVARCWAAAVKIAIERRVDAVVVAGDVFHSRNPDALSLNLFTQELRALEDAEIPTVIIAGNHDGAAHPQRLSVLHVLESQLVHVRARPDVVDVDGLRIACLPWASRAQLTANSPGISRGAAVEAQTEALERVLDDLRARGADILTAHWSVQGAVLGSEADIAIVGESEPVLPLSSLEGPWLYAALGHIHGQQSGRVGQTAWAYSGSIDRMNFGEEKEPKVALEFNSDEPDHKMPHHLPARRFVTIDDATTGPHDVTDAIVRVRLRRTEDELRELDRAALERELLDAGAARVLIQVDVVRPSRARAERVTASLSLEESIAEWFNAADVDETDRPVLTDMAKALAEETAS